MSWFVFSLIAPLCLALANVVDDVMSRGPFKGQPMLYVFAGALVLMLPAAAIFITQPEVLTVPPVKAVIMLGMGAGLMTGFIGLYILAMQKTGATSVAPIFQTVPALVFIGGYFAFGETVSLIKLIACGVVMLAAIGINWDFKARKLPLGSIALMLAAAAGVAIYSLLARAMTGNYSPSTILAYVWLGFGGLALIVFIISASYRRRLRNLIDGAPRLSICGLAGQGVCQVMGEMCIVSAMKTVPATGFVQTIGSIQPAFVYMMIATLGYLAPRFYGRMKLDRILVWKIACMAVMFGGVAVLSLTGE